MEEIVDILMGVDKKKEIFNLWFELNFLRHCFNSILTLNPELHKDFDQKWLDKCREMSLEEVKKKFPHCNIDYIDPSEKKEESLTTLPEDESKRKAEEILKTIREAWKNPPKVILDQMEDPSYTPQDHKSEPISCPPPLNEP